MEKAENESAFSPLGVQICPCQNYQDFLFKKGTSARPGRQGWSWHGADSAPISGYYNCTVILRPRLICPVLSPRSTSTWPWCPVKGSGRRARRELVSAWLCPPYPFAPCRRIVQRVAGTKFFYLQIRSFATKSIPLSTTAFHHFAKDILRILLIPPQF